MRREWLLEEERRARATKKDLMMTTDIVDDKALTIGAIQRAIDAVLDESQNDKFVVEKRWKLSRWNEIEDGKGGGNRPGPTPLFFAIRAENAETETTLWEVSFYFAYSTWDGKILYIDQLKKNDTEEGESESVWWHHCLARIAVRLHCTRLTWRVSFV